MMGYSHVVSGMGAGLLLLPAAPVSGGVEQVAWVLMWGGAALLPDLDSPGASASRMWGPISRAISRGVNQAAQGHRWGTHDLVLGPLVFGALAALAILLPPATLFVLAVALGLALHGLHVARIWRTGALLNLVVSWGGALWLMGREDLTIGWWLPLSVVGGVLVAIVGDWLTNEGVPVPLLWIKDRSRRWGLGAFRTGSAVETFLIAPVLTLGTLVLASGRLAGVV